jgi:anaerobic magnesium-protoporphyrin IX monomethyl ester cyclase
MTIEKNKLLLIRIPEIEFNLQAEDLRNISIGGLTVPLGVAYLAAVARRIKGWDVKVLDLYGEYFDEFTRRYRAEPKKILSFSRKIIGEAIESYQPEAIGLSAPFLFQHNLIKELARSIRKEFPGIKIYLGGYATIIPEAAMKDIPEIDVLFIGESEKTLVEVLSAKAGSDLKGIKGIAFRTGKKISINKETNLVEDLDSLPFPAFDLLPLPEYEKSFSRNEFPIMTSRSCPFSCGFCSSRLYSKRGLRKRSTANLLAEMKILRDNYNVDLLYIRDDNFIVNKEHAKNFLKGLIKEKLIVPWIDTSGFHVNSIDEELLDLCKATQCTQVIFAVESGSPRVLKEIMNKNVDLEHAKKMAAYCRKIGLSVQCYFVIGNPGETKEEIIKTIDFASQMQVDHCTFSIATPFPGTKYFEIAVQKGYMIHSPEYILGMKYMEANMGTKEFSSVWLKDAQYDANIRVNFLENRLLLGDRVILKKALKKYSRIFEQYNFHAVAGLVLGYLYGKLGNTEQQEKTYAHILDLLTDGNIKKAYAKYIKWKTAPTNSFRQWNSLRRNTVNK